MAIYILGPDSNGDCCTCAERVNVCDTCGGGGCTFSCFAPYVSVDFLACNNGNGSFGGSASSGSPTTLSMSSNDSVSSNEASAQIIGKISVTSATNSISFSFSASASPSLLGTAVIIGPYYFGTQGSHSLTNIPVGQYQVTLISTSNPGSGASTNNTMNLSGSGFEVCTLI